MLENNNNNKERYARFKGFKNLIYKEMKPLKYSTHTETKYCIVAEVVLMLVLNTLTCDISVCINVLMWLYTHTR